MNTKYRSLLAMLLCGASFATQATPVGFTNNYSGEYNCILSATSDCTSTTTRWTLGFNIDPSAPNEAPWRFEMLDGQNVTLYESSQGSMLSYNTDGYSHIAWMVTSAVPSPYEGELDYTSLLVIWNITDIFLPGDPDSLTGIGSWRVATETGEPAFHEEYRTGPGDSQTNIFAIIGPLMQSAGNLTTPFTRSEGGISLMDSRWIYHSVPEPASIALLAIGIAAYGVNRRR